MTGEFVRAEASTRGDKLDGLSVPPSRSLAAGLRSNSIVSLDLRATVERSKEHG